MSAYLKLDGLAQSGQPARMHLFELEAMMLWPDDEVQRSRAHNAAMVHHGLEIAEAGQLTQGGILALARLAAESPPLSDVQAAAKERYERGLRAGKHLFDAVSRTSVGKDVALTQMLDEVGRRYLGVAATHSRVGHTEIWAVYRSVAHLWAAHWFYASRGVSAFPCVQERLLTFLAIAEDIRVTAEKLRPRKKAPSTILRPGESVRLPVGLGLPLGSLRFEASVLH